MGVAVNNNSWVGRAVKNRWTWLLKMRCGEIDTKEDDATGTIKWKFATGFVAGRCIVVQAKYKGIGKIVQKLPSCAFTTF
jgi:hypothetical protein